MSGDAATLTSLPIDAIGACFEFAGLRTIRLNVILRRVLSVRMQAKVAPIIQFKLWLFF